MDLFQKDCHERHVHDKGCFSNFWYRAQEPTHTRTQHRQYKQVFLSYYFIKQSLKLGSNTYHWGLKLFSFWKIILNFMKSIGHYFCPTVLMCLWDHMAYWHVTWPLGESFAIGDLLTILIKKIHMWHNKQKRSKVRFGNTVEMGKDWSNTLDRMRRQNWDANIGLKKLWNWYEMLVPKDEGKLLVDSGILPEISDQIFMFISKVGWYFSYIH